MKLFWPMLLVILSNTLYNVTAKATPEKANPFVVIMVSYLSGAALALILYVFNPGKESFFAEATKVNWSTFLLGASIVGVEFGYIAMYRAGWNFSVASLVANLVLALLLLVIGVWAYKEQMSPKQMVGVALCVAGLFMINQRG